MPVSHDKRWAFIHVPKTAGISLLRALAASDARPAFAGRGLPEAMLRHPQSERLLADWRAAYPIARAETAPQQHLPAAVLRALVGADAWSSYLTFCVVRNPWDLVLSTYAYQRACLARGEATEFAPVLERYPDFRSFARAYPTLRSDQSALLEIDGAPAMDMVLRFETLEADVVRLSELLGVTLALPHENRSERGAYRDRYDAEGRAAVARHFARDIERFGYAF